MQEMQETLVRPLGQKDPLKEGMANRSSIPAWVSIPAWGISWTEEPGRLQLMGSQRVGLREGVHTCTDGITDGWSFTTKNHGCPVFTPKRTKGSATNSEEENALQNVLPCGDPTVKGVYPLCSQL